MEYRIIIKDRKDYYEATSYYSRTADSYPWMKLKKPEKCTLEEVILNSALEIAHKHKKRLTRIFIHVK